MAACAPSANRALMEYASSPRQPRRVWQSMNATTLACAIPAPENALSRPGRTGPRAMMATSVRPAITAWEACAPRASRECLAPRRRSVVSRHAFPRPGVARRRLVPTERHAWTARSARVEHACRPATAELMPYRATMHRSTQAASLFPTLTAHAALVGLRAAGA